MEEKMSRRSTKIPTCSPLNKEGSDWRVESIVSIDERGQMVLPKELRDKAKIRAGDKLALISWDKDGEICCLYLIKTEHLAESVRNFLGPMAREGVS
jgi:AbrB family looped-hinge helix DNA binding protein